MKTYKRFDYRRQYKNMSQENLKIRAEKLGERWTRQLDGINGKASEKIMREWLYVKSKIKS